MAVPADATPARMASRAPNLTAKRCAAHTASVPLAARTTILAYNNQDHAMMTSMLTVKNILANAPLYDAWNVNEDAEYHETDKAAAQTALKNLRWVPHRIGAG
jgi:hypothetical protein